MNIFKKLFGKKRRKNTKNAECWYNNSHEKVKKKLQWTNPDDSGGAYEGTHLDMAQVRSMTDRQC